MDYGFGCNNSKVDLRDYKIKVGKSEYPEEFTLENLPKVKNQQAVGSCVAHATSSILEYHDKCNHVLSTNYIYGLQKKICADTTKGMSLIEACKIVKGYGDALETDCPGNNEVPACFDIAETAFANNEIKNRAIEYKIASYYKCLTENDIKYALITYGPVLCSINWYKKYTFDKQTKIVTFDTTTTKSRHAVMIYGWTKDGWLIQNSWGTSWFDKGRFILPYKYKYNEARCLIDYVPEADDNIVIPTTNSILDIIYKGLNFIINIFSTNKKNNR